MTQGFVLDCSAVMGLCFKDEFTEYHTALLDRFDSERAVVPAIWPVEVCNVLVIAERQKRIIPEQSLRFLAHLAELQIEIVDLTGLREMAAIVGVARDHKLTAYDAQYLFLALQQKLPLFTLDRALRKAAVKVDVQVV